MGRMSLRSSITAVACLRVVLTVAVTTRVQSFLTRQAVLEEVRASGDGIAESLARAAAFAAEVPLQVEDEMGRQMETQARLVAELVGLAERVGVSVADIDAALRRVAERSEIEILTTDSQGRAYLYTNDTEETFVFSSDPREQPQAHVFHRLLTGTIPSVVQSAQRREIDDKVFKYVGVGGVDRPRIVQVGMEATFLQRLDKNLGLSRLVNDLVAGAVREVCVFDADLAPVVARRATGDGGYSDAPTALRDDDRELLQQCLIAGRPTGRVTSDDYRVAAAIRRMDGTTAGAVVVAISTATARSVLGRQLLAGIVAAVGIGLPGMLAGLWLARSIATPVREAVRVAEAIAAGDFTRPVPVGGMHEVGRLLTALTAMSTSLGGLIGRIQAAGARLSSVEAETAATLQRQDRAISGFDEATAGIAAAVAEISATSQELFRSTSRVRDVAREARDVADEGRGGLARITESMRKLDEAMDAFTRKLASISQRATGITAVVTTIAKIAEQTNLLSLNATIEAEKAGETGRGFRIVAQEIRRLADQTGLATKDIARMVREMQTAVSSGTMEMDRFRGEVNGRVAAVAEVTESLGHVSEPVQAVSDSLEQVHEGMRAQSQGADQIRQAMEALRSGAGESAAATAIVYASLDELRAAISELNAEAGRFTASSSAAGRPVEPLENAAGR